MFIRPLSKNIRTIAGACALAVFLVMGISGVVRAAFNPEINYQGKLLNSAGSAVADGTYHMKFRLYDALTGGTLIAEENRSVTAGNRVQVQSGLFSVMLGSSTALSDINFNQPLYLEVEIGGTASSGWEVLTPRKRLGAVPAAFEAARLSGIASSSFVRSDEADTIAANTASTLLTINQSGSGNIFELLDNGAAAFTVATNGFVGVGTSSPFARFTVQGGDTYIGGNLTATGTITVGGGTSTIAGNIDLGGDVNADQLFVTGATSSFANGLSIASGCFAVNGTCLTAASATLLDNLSDVDTSGVSAGNTLAYDGVNWVPMSTSSYVTTSEISTSALLAGLLGDETGSAGGGLAVFSNNPLLAGFVSNASSTIGGGTAGGGLTVFGGATTTGNAYFAANVGIGSSSPTQALSIRGSGATTMGISNGTVNNTITTDSGGTLTFNTSAGNSYIWSQSGTERMRLTNGSLGIGTSSPMSMFTVVGEIRAANFVGTSTATSSFGGALSVSGAGTSTFANSINLNSGCFSVSGVCLVTGAFDDWTQGGTNFIAPSSTVGMIVSASSTIGGGTSVSGLTINGGATSTGNIAVTGLGTSTISGKLSIAGQLETNYGLRVIGLTACDSLDTDASGNIVCGADAGAAGSEINWTYFNTSGVRMSTTTQQVLIGATATTSLAKLEVVGDQYLTGKLGIGTTSPYAALSVVGEAVAQFFTATSTFPSLFTGGFTAGASSTIGGGSTSTGLTINGTATTTGNLVVRGSATSTFQNGITIAGGCFRDGVGCLTSAGATLLDALADVDTTGVAAGNFLWFDGTNWVDLASSSIGVNLADTQGVLGPTRGGTGLSIYSQGDLIYSDANDSLANLSVGTPGYILSVVNGVPGWVSTSSFVTASEISTSALLAGLLGDETGSAGGGLTVFSNNPLLAGFVSNASSTIGGGSSSTGLTINGRATTTGDFIVFGSTTLQQATTTALRTNTLGIGSDFITDITGTGLSLANGVLSADVSGNWTGTFDGLEGTFYLANSFSTTSATHFLSLNQGAAFSTTSADNWRTVRSLIDGSGAANHVAYYSDADTLTSNATFVFDGANLGIGTSTPWGRLSVTAASGTTSPMFLVASSTLTNAAFIVTSAGSVGIGTTSPMATLSINGSFYASTTATSVFTGGLSVGNGSILHDYGSGVTSINNLELGAVRFDTNAGVVTWIDMPVTGAAATGTIMAYSAAMDNLDALTIWSEVGETATGTVTDLRVVVGTSTGAILSSANIPYGSLLVADGALCVDNGSGDSCDNFSLLRGMGYFDGGLLSMGNAAVGTIDPLARFAIVGATSTTNLLRIASSSGQAIFDISYTGSSTIGGGSTSTGLTINGGATTTGVLTVQGTGTSTFARGINIANGCFAIAGTCVGGSGAGTVNSGTQGQIAYYAGAGTAVSGTSSLFIDTTTSRVTIATTTGFSASKLTIDAGNTGMTPLAVASAGVASFLSGSRLMLAATFSSGTDGGYIENVAGNLNLAPSSGAIRFIDQAGTSEYMRITNSGTVGIGTADPLARFAIVGATSTTNLLRIASSTGQAIFDISYTGSSTIGGGSASTGLTVNGVATTTGYLVIQSTGTSTNAGNFDLAGDINADQLFLTGGTSTAANGFNITTGCYAVNGTCLSTGAGTIDGAGATDRIAYFSDTDTLTTNAEFTFNGTSLNLPFVRASTTGSTTQQTLFMWNDLPIIVASSTLNNLSFGPNSLSATTTGASNTALGSIALRWNTTGTDNVAVGRAAISANTSGSFNTAVGRSSLLVNTSGGLNTVVGYAALSNNNGTGTIAIGYQAGDALTSGDSNILIGYDIDAPAVSTDNFLSIGNLIFGNGVGRGIGTQVATGTVGIGTSTPWARLSVQGTSTLGITPLLVIATSTGQQFLTVGYTGSTTIGAGSTSTGLTIAGGATTTGSLVVQGTGSSTFQNGINLATGCFAISGTCLSTGGASTFLSLTDTPSSFSANRVFFTNSGATAITDAPSFTFDTTYLSAPILNASTSASTTQQTLFAWNNLPFIVASSTLRNLSIGVSTLSATTTGTENLAIGSTTLRWLVNGSYNIGIGGGALRETTSGSYNTAIGVTALASNVTGSTNTAIGYESMFNNTSGANNLSIGYTTMRANTAGVENVALGDQVLLNNTFGSRNVAVGFSALNTNVFGSYNVALGHRAIENNAATGTIAIGYQAGNNLTAGDFNILIGHDIDAPSATVDGFMSIGNLIYGRGLGQTGTAVATGTVGIGTSTPWARLSVQGTSTLGAGTPIFTVATSTGSSVFTVAATGYVGIGTTTPQTHLSIDGNGSAAGINIGDDTQAHFLSLGLDRMMMSFSSTYGIIQAGANRGLTFNVNSSSLGESNGTAMRINSVGNVGVGSSTPWSKLSVTASSGQSVPVFTVASSSFEQFFTVAADGNVGIGTSSPFADLSVIGSIFASSTATSTFLGSFVLDNGRFSHNYVSGETSITNLNLGPVRFDDDAGWLSWVDMPVTAAGSATGTPMAFSAQIDSQSLLTVYAETGNAASGTIKNTRVVVGTTTAGVLGSANIPFGSMIIADGALCVDDGAADGQTCASSGRARGGIFAASSNLTALDVAETYPVEDISIVAGAIVSLDAKQAPVCAAYKVGPNQETLCDGYATTSVPFVKKADKSAGEVVLGIISTEPGVLLGGFGSQELSEYAQRPVALKGRVPVIVNGEGGNIHAGDRIMLSSISGIGTRATTTSETFAIALEDATLSASSATSSVMVFVENRHHFVENQLFIDATGKVGIGTTTPGYELTVQGSVAANAFVNISSESTKKDIDYVDEVRAEDIFEAIREMRVAEYRYNYESAAAPLRMGLIAEESPIEVLSVASTSAKKGRPSPIVGVDLYKLASLTLVGVQELDKRVTTLEELMGLASSTAPGTAEGGVMGILSRMGIAINNGLTAIANLTAAEFTVGSSERPTGITMFDEVTGEPFCMKIRNGQTVTTPGACVAAAPAGDEGSEETGDTAAPDISMSGDPVVVLFINDPYTDAGAVANDTVDGSVPVITLINGTPADTVSIDTSAPGTYTITYRAIDAAGNVATRSRLVTVSETIVEVPTEEVTEGGDEAPTTPAPSDPVVEEESDEPVADPAPEPAATEPSETPAA